MKRAVLLGAILALVGVACSSTSSEDPPSTTELVTGASTTTAPPSTTTTTTPPTTTTTTIATTTTLSEAELAQIEYDEDVVLMRQMWRDFSDSWFSGVDAGYAFMEEHSHPSFNCTAADFSLQGWVDGDRSEVIIDRTTIERDDGWESRLGEIPEGRIYIMTADIAYTYVGQADQLTKAEVHSAVLDGKAYFFINCGR